MTGTVLRWGVLGAAKIAMNVVIPAIQASTNGTVVAIAARDRSRADALATRFAIPRVHDYYETLLEDPEIDAVYIPLPASHHVGWTMRALEAGKHVLCEKPIALKATEIEELIKARDSSGLMVAEAFMVAHHPQWDFTRKALGEGRIGRLRHVEGCFTYRNLDPAGIKNQPALGGGALRDIGGYPVVTARFATGQEPQRARARIEVDPKLGTDVFVEATLEFEDFSLAFTCGTQQAPRQDMLFHGEEAWMRLACPFNPLIWGTAAAEISRGRNGDAEFARFPDYDQYRLQAEHFADAVAAVRGGTPPKDVPFALPLESSLLNQRAIDACFRAGQSGNWEQV